VRIIVTNDDGYLSPGLYMLYEAVKGLGEAFIISTQFPRSATGREITFSRPLRLFRTRYMGCNVYVTDGTPIDALHLAMEVLGIAPDLVLSGVNVGENLSLQHIFYSGTIAVAIESALMGVPAVAFSVDVVEFSEFNSELLRGVTRVVVKSLIEFVKARGFPRGVDVLSVNIPKPPRFKGCVEVVKAARVRWKASYREGRDPRGRRYYWLYGIPARAEEDTDVAAFESRGCITITPLNIDLNLGTRSISELEAALGGVLSGIKTGLKGLLRRELPAKP